LVNEKGFFFLLIVDFIHIDSKVSNHHSPKDGHISETQELKSLLDNADQRNQEQEQVLNFLFYFFCEKSIIEYLENRST
jgi:hypothetical protein